MCDHAKGGFAVKRLSVAALFLLGLLVSHALAAQNPDAIVPGAGAIGTWVTSVGFANGSDLPVTVRVASVQVPPGVSCAPPFTCLGAQDVTVPGGSFWSVEVSPSFGGPAGPTTLYVTLLAGPALPTVYALMINLAKTSERFEIPVIRTDTLSRLNPSVLVFPNSGFSSLGQFRRSNLLVSVYGGEVTVKVEGGASLPTKNYAIGANSTLELYDLVRVGDLVPVQIRVTKLSGDGAIWGYLVLVDSDRAAATAGANR
jgi:hypothetical protein